MGPKKVIGLISGTSADGIDAALVDIVGSGLETKVTLLAFHTLSYPLEIKRDILRASSPHQGTVDLICHLNFLLGELFAQAVKEVCKQSNTPLSEIDLIGSHGQTIHHLPQVQVTQGYAIRSTLQIGEPSVIAERTGITTIADFRCRDIAAGGIGAPLTPYIHFLLFKHSQKTRAVINLGGIANVTLVPSGGQLDKVMAFDTGPGNMLLDAIVSQLSKGEKSFDQDGEMAFQGRIVQSLRSRLLSHPYLKKPPPKSTGREDFGPSYLDQIIKWARETQVEGNDLVATVANFTVDSIYQNMENFLFPLFSIDEYIICGGGAHNPFLVSKLRERFYPTPLTTCDTYGIPPKALEAVAFAILAHETLSGRPSNLSQVTGARRRVILGKIITGNRECRTSLGYY